MTCSRLSPAIVFSLSPDDTAYGIERVLEANAERECGVASDDFQSMLRDRQYARPDTDIRTIVGDLVMAGYCMEFREWLDDAPFTYCAHNRWLALMRLRSTPDRARLPFRLFRMPPRRMRWNGLKTSAAAAKVRCRWTAGIWSARPVTRCCG